jgi:hypothetical protein
VAEVARLASQLIVLDAQVVGAFDASTEWAADGHRTPTAAVRHESNQATGTARRRVQRARKLRHLDELSGALAAGEISTDGADVLLGADRPEVHTEFVDDEELLVEYARALEHVDLVRLVRTWSDLKQPDDADGAAGKREEERSLHGSRTLGGRVRVDGWLTPLVGTEFLAELDRREKVLFEADWADARERLGDKATKDDLVRTPAQRRHDAFAEIVRRSAAGTGDGPAPRGRVVLNLHMDHPTFCAELARHTGEDYDYPADRLCEFDDGAIITPSEALNLALGGEVRRIVFGADGHVLDYGRSRRLFTGALADAIGARDRRCQMPGCLLPAAKCQVDHVHEHQHGGATCEINGETACRFHNLWKTNNLARWTRLRQRDADRFQKKRRPPPRE